LHNRPAVADVGSHEPDAAQEIAGVQVGDVQQRNLVILLQESAREVAAEKARASRDQDAPAGIQGPAPLAPRGAFSPSIEGGRGTGAGGQDVAPPPAPGDARYWKLPAPTPI